MNGRERMDAAMQLREPDRVPVMCQLSLGHIFYTRDWTQSRVGIRRRPSAKR
jgi:hypothetical protein